ncbi:MAG: AtpZ/AtpI family protein [Chloroflexota bacterium]
MLGTIGGYVALSLMIGLGIGLLLDYLFHSSPLFLIAGVVLGFIASFYATYRVATGELGD